MKRLTLTFLVLITFITTFCQTNEIRLINEFVLGDTNKDSLISILNNNDYKVTIQENTVSVKKYWYQNFCFDYATFFFLNQKLKKVLLSQECFDLSTSDKFGKDFLEMMKKKYGEFTEKNSIYTYRDKQTLIRAAQQTNEDRTSDFKVVIIDLISE